MRRPDSDRRLEVRVVQLDTVRKLKPGRSGTAAKLLVGCSLDFRTGRVIQPQIYRLSKQYNQA